MIGWSNLCLMFSGGLSRLLALWAEDCKRKFNYHKWSSSCHSFTSVTIKVRNVRDPFWAITSFEQPHSISYVMIAVCSIHLVISKQLIMASSLFFHRSFSVFLQLFPTDCLEVYSMNYTKNIHVIFRMGRLTLELLPCSMWFTGNWFGQWW